MLACHAGGPGSIPGRCTFLKNTSMLEQWVTVSIPYLKANLLLLVHYIQYEVCSIVGSMVECSPPTRTTRVRFPDDAWFKICVGWKNNYVNHFSTIWVFISQAAHIFLKIGCIRVKKCRRELSVKNCILLLVVVKPFQRNGLDKL